MLNGALVVAVEAFIMTDGFCYLNSISFCSVKYLYGCEICLTLRYRNILHICGNSLSRKIPEPDMDTEHRGRVVNTPASYSRCPRFKSWPRRPAILIDVYRGFS
jgi:hypothetical protein